jgi:hypothetical protein
MKKATITALLFILALDSFTQDFENKFIAGTSISITHDDAANNLVLLNNANLNVINTYNISGEFGYFLSPKSIIGAEVGITIKKDKPGINQNNITSFNKYGISINPKYKFIKKISDEIWLYTDFKAIFQYVSHENIISQLDQVSYEYVDLNMIGTEYKYGIAVNPGCIINVFRNIGIKIDYSLLSIIHSSIRESDNNEVPFEDIKAWDYGINMKVSGLNLGIICLL